MFNLKTLTMITLLLSGTTFAETSLSVVNKKETNTELDYSNLNISFVEIEGSELLEEDKKTKNLRKIIERLDKSYKGALIEPLEEIEGFYKVTSGKNILYITEDGGYLIPTIAKVEGDKFVDLKKDDQEKMYKEYLSNIKDNEVVTYNSTTDKRMSIYVFSDYTCPYCKKLHENILNITDMGLDVKYIPYPRNGFEDKPALLGLQKIMCSSDPKSEFDLAFKNPRNYVKGLTTQDTNCFNGKSSLHKSLTLGDKMDVYGTPFIFTEDGVFLGTWGGVNKLKLKVEKELLKKEGLKWD